MFINHANLARVDLNLLTAFDALLTELNVTRAAMRVGVGQSAMSQSLARLRVLFGDELLTRASDGMRATPRARALVEPVRDTLARIERLTSRDDEFEPLSSDRVFIIGMIDSMEVLLAPLLAARLAREAPSVRLHLRSIIDPAQVLADLDEGKLDLAIAIGAFANGRVHHKRRLLLTDQFLCMFNSALVNASSPITLEDYVRIPHVMTSLRQEERGVVDEALAALGLKREIAIITPRFVSVPFVVQNAPMLTTMHGAVARLLSGPLKLDLSPPPVNLPNIPVQLLWHASYDRDPAHLWLRQTLTKIAAVAA